jgi:hypothetical protein
MSILSKGPGSNAKSASVKSTKSNSKESAMTEKRAILRLEKVTKKDGTTYRAWYLCLLTDPKSQLKPEEKAALLKKFWSRPADENGEYKPRRDMNFYVTDKTGVNRAWYWLADESMVTQEEVLLWVKDALSGTPAKKAPGKKYADAVVDATPKKAPAKKAAAPAAKKAKAGSKKVAEFAIG